MRGMDPEQKRLLMEMIKPKFETYFRVAKYLVRSIPNPQPPGGRETSRSLLRSTARIESGSVAERHRFFPAVYSLATQCAARAQ
jgi:hypothetical protein